MNTKPLVLYHANCWDGFCAAWIVHRAMMNPDIEAVPVHYGQPAPDVFGRTVYILDFSYPRAQLMAMAAAAGRLVVIDHHATAESDLQGLPFCRFDSTKSAGRLTWEYFFGDQKSPWLVDYTEDRDLWRHALPDTREINAALRSYPLNFDQWDRFALMDVESLVIEGEAIRRAESAIVNAHVRNASYARLEGHRVQCVNATALFSEIAGQLAVGHAFGMTYLTGRMVNGSGHCDLTRTGVDVSAIASMYGGGGHKHAAGFETSLPWTFSDDE